MKERLKSILLFFLVVMSLYFAQRLWIRLPESLAERFEPMSDSYTTYALSDMISPYKYIINFGNKNHTLFYGDNKYSVWDDSREILSQVLGSDNIITEEITREQYLDLKEERSLVIYFPEEISTYILAKTWGVNNPNNITDAIPNTNEMYIYLGTEDPFFVFILNEKYLAVYDQEIDTTLLKEKLVTIDKSNNYDRYHTMREAYQIDNDVYIPNRIENSLPIVYVSNEISTLNDEEKRELAKKFFDEDIDYVREIVESNGSTIYLYSNKSLKLNINGTLEYFHAIEDKVPERNLYISLVSAAEFIKDKSLSQDTMYLSSIEDIESGGNLGYRLRFRYRVGNIPVILGNREFGDYIQIDVYNYHIRNYKLLARGEMKLGLNAIIDSRSMLSSFDILDKNYEFLVNEYLYYAGKTKESYENYLRNVDLRDEVLSAVDDVSLSYYDPYLKDKEERLIGVWVISAGNRLYGFNIYTGDLVFER
ncbi:MAG: hypothetical protein GX231_02050 [Tissierellia bacterium]|nr:hypothetical protein [Tissierellia bacterium]